MKKVAIDLFGRRFGSLAVLERAGTTKDGHAAWLCRCDCGAEKIVSGHSLLSGATQSCGCLQRSRIRESNSEKKKTHGMTGTRLYNIWGQMKQRCENVGSINYPLYGGRGIFVCDEWRENPDAFFAWALANGYRDSLTLDRKDNNGPYCPKNCRWATVKQQSNNRRNSKHITYDGETRTIGQWAEALEMRVGTLHGRLSKGWPIERALTEPVAKRAKKGGEKK